MAFVFDCRCVDVLRCLVVVGVVCVVCVWFNALLLGWNWLCLVSVCVCALLFAFGQMWCCCLMLFGVLSVCLCLFALFVNVLSCGCGLSLYD